MTHLILSHSVTCQPPHAPSTWQLRACEAADHGCCVRHSGEVEAEGEGGKLNTPRVCLCVRERTSARDCTCDRLARAHAHQDEGMDGCQRREQHHVRVLADDAHFRYTNSNSQLSHETISSHDSPHSLPVCFVWFATRCMHSHLRLSECEFLIVSAFLGGGAGAREAPSRSQLIWVSSSFTRLESSKEEHVLHFLSKLLVMHKIWEKRKGILFS